MYRLLVTSPQLAADTLTVARQEARHLTTVLRVRPGQLVTLFDGKGRTRAARVTEIGKQAVLFTMAGELITHPPRSCAITLFACVSKGTRMEWMVEKATEIGVATIVPVLSERTVARPTDSARWQRIAAEATRQSSSCWLPVIENPITFAHAVELAHRGAPLLVAALLPTASPLRSVIDALPPPSAAAIFVGPEGDFTVAEYAALAAAGAVSVSLGSQVLRAETACIYALAVMAASWLWDSADAG